MLSKADLKKPGNTAMFESMNAAQVIQEIDAMPAEERDKVVIHLDRMQERLFHEKQVEVAECRLEDLENGLTETVSHEEAMRMVREG